MFKKVILLLVALLIGGYFLFMGAYTVTSEPSFCAKCHEVQPYYNSWQNFPHKDVKCLFCHEPRGYLGKIHSKIRGLNYVHQHFSDNYTVFVKAITFEENCIACHLGDNKQYPDTVRLNNKKVNHFELIKNNVSCLECHRDIGHENKIFLNPDFQKTWKKKR